MVKGTIIICLFFLSFFAGIKFYNLDSWEYKIVPSKFRLKEQTSLANFITLNKKVAYIADYLPKNFVENATQDYTKLIQEILDKERNVVFPNFPILVNESGLTISSNSNIYFNKKTILKLKSNPLKEYEILRIHDVQNVTVYNAKIEGDKHRHIGKLGEWGMGISIRGTKNITLYNSEINTCWGDGIYLGTTKKNYNNLNINIINTFLNDNRRNGLSIIAAENLQVNNLVVTNTNGTNPMAGIDIEPDENQDIISNLNFKNIVSFNNTVHGFLIVTSNLDGNLPHEKLNISINDFASYYGEIGMSFKLQHNIKAKNVPKGDILINNPKFYKNSRTNFLSYDGNEDNFLKVKIVNSSNGSINSKFENFNKAKNFEIIKQ